MLYKDAGVNVEKKESLLSYVKKFSGEIGRFGGRFPLGKKTLVASVDGVGTKLLIALSLQKHDTVGEDLVNHCIDDILCEGAKPLFFMDYIGVGKLNEAIFEGLISGIVNGCKKNDIVLLGGETAELPSFYTGNRYDLVGFIVGITDERMERDDIREGDVLVGLPSNGLHTNGYSLVRKIIEEKKLSLDRYIAEFRHTLGEELMRVHRSYLDQLSCFPPFSSSSSLPTIKGIAHITGGGFYGNIPRVVPGGYGVVIKGNSWEVPPVFKFIKEMGKVPEDEMYRVFNMGIGMVLIVDRNRADTMLNRLGEGYIIGEVTKGRGLVLTF